jgi:hypothetical protein
LESEISHSLLLSKLEGFRGELVNIRSEARQKSSIRILSGFGTNDSPDSHWRYENGETIGDHGGDHTRDALFSLDSRRA